jgi:cobalt-precorrin 5A hydrolase/precorrin-3B C17-methyltransferase
MSTGNRIAALYITEKGRLLAERLRGLYPDLTMAKYARGKTKKAWEEHGGLIFIMAAGIVVRTIAPLMKDKRTDPAVIVLDENGKYAISLLSGHLGGANDRAKEIADFLGAEAVITTASDVSGLPSIDIWARDNDLVIEDWKTLPHIATRLINEGRLNVYADIGIALPGEFLRVPEPAPADLLITNKKTVSSHRGERPFALTLRPKNLVIGIGCNSGTSAKEIEGAVKSVLEEKSLSFSSLRSIATIDIKTREPGLRLFAENNALEILSFSPEELNSVAGVSRSEAAFRATGAHAVAEPAALLASGAESLLVPKQKKGNVTVAAAEIRRQGAGRVGKKGKETADKPGKIYVVGTGPGSIAHITPYAQQAIRKSDVIVGYGTYIELIPDLLRDKEVFSTGMTQEIDRCRKAVELALDGKTVSVISGGDPGIYAMAGLVFEILSSEARKLGSLEANGKGADIAVEVVPGISALNACAARLGAPLMHDFASISLSDRLTPWELIEKRLDAAAMADFVIVLYNPKSRGRAGHIGRAREIILKHRSRDTPVGIVKGAMRGDEKVVLTDLGKMLDCEIDMQTTVIIGNSKTFEWNNLMITPRGYEKKFNS